MNETVETFSNRPIAADSLPDFREAGLNRVVPAYLKHKVATTVGFWGLFAVAALLSNLLPAVDLGESGYFVAGAAVIMLLSLLHARFDARHRGWALREHDLIYQSGVVFRKQVILPFARIQHVETLSGPVERYFDLMRVKCFTAGGASADLVVEGLTTATAGQVRQYLLEQIRDDEPAAESQRSSDAAD
ncbi:MAG: PH domain-containing protein [Wenzhouxiangella sp.]|jgi:membrane protein YdbS with pleckstrin-like domain|nr:PH domain-containing protein [Wenzhouxiangella sp.]